MNWIDIIFIAIIVLFAIIGLAKGLIDSILSLFTTFGSAILAYFLAKPFYTFFAKIFDINGMFENLLTQTFGLSDPVSIFGNDLTIAQMGEFISIVFSGIVAFVLVRSVVWLVSKIFDSATKSSSALSGLNRLFGLLFGAVKGLAICCLVLGVASIMTYFGDFGTNIKNTIEDTTVTNFVFKYVDEFVEDKITNTTIADLLGVSSETPSE